MPKKAFYHVCAKKLLNMLMKLTQGVYFTNILQADFSYESVFRSFSLFILWLCKFLVKEYQRKCR